MALLFTRTISGALVRHDTSRLPNYRDQSEAEGRVLQILESAMVYTIGDSAGQNLKRDDWVCDGWRFTFEKGAQKTAISEQFEYFTGTGHRYPKKPKPGVDPKPTLPHVAGVLHSILMDSDAENMSFMNWCAEYGYSDDSLKAFDTYRACCDIGKKLRRIFTPETIAQLREALGDY